MLNELVRNVELERCGIINQFAEPAKQPIQEHFADFVVKLSLAGRTEDYLESTKAKLKRIAEWCGFVSIIDINPDAVSRFGRYLKDKDFVARTVQSYLSAVKSFTRWLTEPEKLARDPLVTVSTPNPETDRRLERRMLLNDEWAWLRRFVLSEDVERYGVDASERIALYATGIQTGLRSGELRSLTRGRLFLD